MNLRTLRPWSTFAVVLALLVSAGCASIPIGYSKTQVAIVRAEDALTNGLTAYRAVMTLHYQFSERETPELYTLLEKARGSFLPLWRTLRNTTAAVRAGQAGDVEAARKAVQDALDELAEALVRLEVIKAKARLQTPLPAPPLNWLYGGGTWTL